jgi:hypothetical protein
MYQASLQSEILKWSHRIDFGSALWEEIPSAREIQAICEAQVVLNISIGIDGCEWAALTRLKAV